MKRSNPLFFVLLGLAMFLAALPAPAAPPELFTNDYYVANAGQWLNKEVTLSVAYFSPADGKFSMENMEVMDAYTFHNHVNGGHINVVATPEVFARLRTVCGTHLLKKAGWVQTAQIHGIFKQKDGQYYVQVDK
jgi:hypothetical protein